MYTAPSADVIDVEVEINGEIDKNTKVLEEVEPLSTLVVHKVVC